MKLIQITFLSVCLAGGIFLPRLALGSNRPLYSAIKTENIPAYNAAMRDLINTTSVKRVLQVLFPIHGENIFDVMSAVETP